MEWLSDDDLDRKDCKTFQAVVEFVIGRKLINISRATKLFEYNTASISRWRNGKNFPKEIYRDAIISKIEDEIIIELKHFEIEEDKFNKPFDSKKSKKNEKGEN